MTAYRGRYRWEQTFKPIRASRSSVRLHKTEPTKSLIREGGVYLITGGLGGIGLVLAEELASKSAKLILTGRSAFPEREAWAQWLATHDENDQVSHKIRKVQALEELGAQVLVISADVANQKQMEAVINQAQKTFGQLNGVIHAAGAVKESFRLIQEISPTECQNQFRPKVDGLLVLEQVLQGQALDFCVLLSSLSSVLGGLGFVAYSAANLFMDAFTHLHNRQSAIRWLSVNWDGWQLQDTSNAFSSSFGASVAKLAMTPEEGVKAFKLLTLFEDNQEDDQVVVSTGELQARISKWINFETDDQPSNVPVVKSLSSHARPTLQSAYVAPRTHIEQQIVDIWRELLGIGQIGVTDNFFELGGHSLLATQLISRLRSAFQVDLPLHRLFETPTIAGLAEYISAEFDEPSPSQTAKSGATFDDDIVRPKGGQELNGSLSSLVPIQPHGSKRPFFLVPGGGGGESEFLIYAQLIHLLGPEQPVYGFYARGLKDDQPPHSDVETMAADYLQEMRTVQPEGPYLLGGECIGGKVAYEMAQQLQAQGQEVAGLLLMNTDSSRINVYPLRHLQWQVGRQFQRVQHHARQLRALSFGKRIRYIGEKLRPQQTRRAPLTPEPLRMQRIRANYSQLLLRYTPVHPYSGPIILLISEDHYQESPTMGWRELALGGFEVYPLPGDHDSYIGEHVETTAAQLRVCLEAAQAKLAP